MRQIKYIIINETHTEKTPRQSRGGRDLDSGYHYIVNSDGIVRELLDIRQPVQLIKGLRFDTDGYNSGSIGILYRGNLAEDLQLIYGEPVEPTLNSSTDSQLSTLNVKLSNLKDLLVGLRSHFPDAKILGVSEIDGKDIRVSAAMNQLRLELSDLP